jgi:hypothetical protein
VSTVVHYDKPHVQPRGLLLNDRADGDPFTVWKRILGAKKRALTILLLLVIAGVGWYIWSQNQNRLVVTNDSGQVIKTMTVTIGEETATSSNVANGAAVSFPFRNHTETKFALEGQYEDGNVFRSQFPRGTSGEQVNIVIRKGGLLEPKQQ